MKSGSDDKLLTFELPAEGNCIDVHMNRQGLEDLVLYLTRLLDSSELPTHDHLMTESWAGIELTEEAQDANAKLINMVNLRLWPD